MKTAEKTAIETAYDYFKNPKEYPLINNANSDEKNMIIAETLNSIFNFDDNGKTTGLDQATVEKFLKIKKLKGIR